MGDVLILPVFAGMIPVHVCDRDNGVDSPRIRGDDPCLSSLSGFSQTFSPYSRG